MTAATKWAARVEAWRASGQSAREFAAGRGFAEGTLRYWASRLRSPAAESAKSEVRIARVVRLSPAATADTPIVIELGVARVGVRRGFDREVLVAVLETLGARELPQ